LKLVSRILLHVLRRMPSTYQKTHRWNRAAAATSVATGLEVEVRPLPGQALALVEAEWTALQTDAAAPPYLTFNWLESWAAVYGPRRLRLIRILDPNVGLVAVGLLEELPLRRLRFAGAPITPITPVRGLLCREAYEASSLQAVAGSGFALGLDRGAWGRGARRRAMDVALPRAVVTPEPWLGFELPGSYDEYLAARSPTRRREFRRRIRVAEREGASHLNQA
jgi:CelD/BcsL family acetyltransferase involved in cellulose biosynthesis